MRELSGDDPETVGPYRLRARIGAGGMGRVYLAHSPGGRPLAVKVVRPELAGDPEFRARFRQEVAAARRVRGMFTAEVVDADTEADSPWLATAYVSGPSLQDAVREHGPLPVESVWLLVAGVAEALQAVHASQVIHRDLKPGNVLLADDGPRVIDFGIARAAESTAVTRTGVNVGSPRFMSPEHARGEHLTPAADVFALGAVAVFAATGAGPFGDGPDAAVLYRVVNEEPALERVPAELRELVARCLTKDPAGRPSPAEVIETCRAAGFTSLRLGAGWLPAPDAVPPPVVPSRRRMYLAAAAGVVAALVVAGFWWQQRDTPGTASPPSSTPTTEETYTVAGPAPDPVEPAERLGPPDWDGFCVDTGQGRVELVREDAYGWRCSAGNETGDDASDVCSWTYDTGVLTNRVRDFNDPESWECWRAELLGPLDFGAYCETRGLAVDQRPELDAYGWFCAGEVIDTQVACQELYGSDPAVSRFQNFYDPNSWECWG
jgi:hypothetical protein